MPCSGGVDGRVRTRRLSARARPHFEPRGGGVVPPACSPWDGGCVNGSARGVLTALGFRRRGGWHRFQHPRPGQSPTASPSPSSSSRCDPVAVASVVVTLRPRRRRLRRRCRGRRRHASSPSRTTAATRPPLSPTPRAAALPAPCHDDHMKGRRRWRGVKTARPVPAASAAAADQRPSSAAGAPVSATGGLVLPRSSCSTGAPAPCEPPFPAATAAAAVAHQRSTASGRAVVVPLLPLHRFPPWASAGGFAAASPL